MTTTIHTKSIATVKADRCIYLMCSSSEKELLDLEKKATSLAEEANFGKVVSKVPQWAVDPLLERGYQLEAEIPGLYGGDTTGYFLANYRDPQRKHCGKKELKIIDSVKAIAKATREDDTAYQLPEDCEVKFLIESEREILVALYQRAFLRYPSPADFSTFVRNTFESGHQFYVLLKNGQLIEACRVAQFNEEQHIEVSDFVTHPDFRGKNLSYHLLQSLESQLRTSGTTTIYGLARASSYGRNITFGKLGYECGGTLRNTRLIGESIESLNVWHKPLAS